MHTELSRLFEKGGAHDWCALNSEIKSRPANLRNAPYTGAVRIEWSISDCELAPTLTAGFACGSDGGDREGFLTRVLAARLSAAGEALTLLFGESAAPASPYSIQLVRSEREELPHAVRVLAYAAAPYPLCTLSATSFGAFDGWIACLGEVFQLCSLSHASGSLPQWVR